MMSRLRADPRRSQGLEFGAVLLECFTSQQPTLGVAEMADMVGLSRSTVHRYATTLVALGYMEQDNRRRYRLSLGARKPGMSFIAALRAETPTAATVLNDLREQTGHTVSMAALDGHTAIYTHRLHAHGTGQYQADLDLGVGARIPIHCTAIGKALLASLSEPEQRGHLAGLTLQQAGPKTITNTQALAQELERVRTTGIATCDQEQAAGVRSIAAPIARPSRSRALAISLTTPASLYDPRAILTHFAKHVRTAAERI